jgi:hypothetical protein
MPCHEVDPAIHGFLSCTPNMQAMRAPRPKCVGIDESHVGISKSRYSCRETRESMELLLAVPIDNVSYLVKIMTSPVFR